MPLSKNINQYQDIKRVLDTAVANGGARYKLPSDKAAVRWRLRAYYYRKLLQVSLQEGNIIPGYTPATPYDMMQLTLDGPIVIIKLKVEEGELLDEAGNPIDAAALPSEEDEDELTRAANELVERHGSNT